MYKKEDIPRSYHFTYNHRISPILVVAEEGYKLCLNASKCDIGGISPWYFLTYNFEFQNYHRLVFVFDLSGFSNFEIFYEVHEINI